MQRPHVYLASVAGSTRRLLEQLGCADAAALLARVQPAIGDEFTVTGDAALIEAGEDDARAGRQDDAERAAAINRVFADERVAAFVALRGGAWLTRILDRIDFNALGRRRRPLAIFGFSELTTLLNIAARYPAALAVHGLGPAFLRAGIERCESLRSRAGSLRSREQGAPTESGLAAENREPKVEIEARFAAEFDAFFAELPAMLLGRGPVRGVSGRLISGALPPHGEARFVGGNLAVMVALLGTPFQAALAPEDRWLLMEDVNESPQRIDRRLAQLKLAGFFERCAGLLVGDFHEGGDDHQAAVLELLGHHLPPERRLPVITTRDVGHVWPMSPLPLNRSVDILADGGEVRFQIQWPRIV